MNVTHVSFQYYPGIMYLLTNSPPQRLESKFITINRSVNCTSAPKILLSKSFSILNAKLWSRLQDGTLELLTVSHRSHSLTWVA